MTTMESFMPFIRTTARRLTVGLPGCVDADDLQSVGTIGLMDAMDKQDPTRTATFGAYARLRIHGAMVDEIRAMLGDWRRSKMGPPIYCSIDDDASFGGELADQDRLDPLRSVIAAREREAMIGAMQMLSAQERLVLRFYYAEDLTMKAIGARLQVTESRICQVHARAITRLRQALGGMPMEAGRDA